MRFFPTRIQLSHSVIKSTEKNEFFSIVNVQPTWKWCDKTLNIKTVIEERQSYFVCRMNSHKIFSWKLRAMSVTAWKIRTSFSFCNGTKRSFWRRRKFSLMFRIIKQKEENKERSFLREKKINSCKFPWRFEGLLVYWVMGVSSEGSIYIRICNLGHCQHCSW